MRHLTGVILAIALSAALFFAAGWGFTHLTAIAAQESMTSGTGVLASAVLAATGLFLGIVLAVRAVSPLAPGLPGLALLAWTVLLAVRPHRALALIPLHSYSFGLGFEALLVSGMLAVLGAAMIIPLFLPSRWRRARRKETDPKEPLPTVPAQPGSTLWWAGGPPTAPITQPYRQRPRPPG